MYSLSDFALYSRDVWLELLATHNADIWPTQLLTAIFGLSLTFLTGSAYFGVKKLAFLVLGLCWLFVAVAFQYGNFTTINWMAYFYATLFAVQGTLLIAFGLLSKQTSIQSLPGAGNRVAVCSILIALVAVPVIGLIDGQAWDQLDYFGVAPDSTALVTVGFLLAARWSSRWWLLISPVIWILISSVQALSLDMLQGRVLLLILMGYMLYFLSRHTQRKRP